MSPNISGKVFNRLTVIEKAYSKRLKYNFKIFWKCRCECGKVVIVNGCNLKNGNTKSCGCLKIDSIKKAQTKHGKTKTPEHNVWLNIKRRCNDKTNKSYENYGGRGIVVCDRWLESFENFYDDMGPRPSKKHSIERINNNGDYSPKNCEWATKRQQNNNKRNNVVIEMNGVRKTLTEWQIHFNISRATFYSRVKRGMTIHKALTTPVKRRRPK